MPLVSLSKPSPPPSTPEKKIEMGSAIIVGIAVLMMDIIGLIIPVVMDIIAGLFIAFWLYFIEGMDNKVQMRRFMRKNIGGGVIDFVLDFVGLQFVPFIQTLTWAFIVIDSHAGLTKKLPAAGAGVRK